MLVHVATDIAYCLEQADEARRNAERATSSDSKAEYLTIERRWRLIAKGQETATRLAHRTNEASRQLDAAKTAAAAPVPELQPPCPTCGNAMWLVRLSKFDDANDLRTFKCQVCEHVESTVAEFKR